MTRRAPPEGGDGPRLLVAIPHYVGPPAAGAAHYGSVLPGAAAARARALERTIAGLRENLGPRQARIEGRIRRRSAIETPHGTLEGASTVVFRQANLPALPARFDIVVVTIPGRNALDLLDLPRDWFEVLEVPLDRLGGDPRMLGFACHEALAARAAGYDWFGYLEDDVAIADGWFLRKVALIESQTNGAAVLLPNRFERRPGRHIDKLYIDGPLADGYTATWQDIAVDRGLRVAYLDGAVILERPANPHAGCFFISASQLARWRAQPWFGDRDTSFQGPLESAATLGIMRTFRIYKPALRHASFLEAEHLNNRDWLGLEE
ncbi:MAG: calcium-binding protein [Alphaproteobacteria bacterium]|nr:calcium-binding protein [Alphaproteobacteria bacterium]